MALRDDLELVLRERGYKLTQQRVMVFELLAQGRPLTTAELIAKLKGRINRVSVYRTIDLFVLLGIAQRVSHGWKYRLELSDRFVSHHHHFNCLACRRTVNIDDRELEDSIKLMAKRQKLIVTAHQIEIQGYCASCTESVNNS